MRNTSILKRLRRWYYRKQVASAVRILQALDVTMSKAGPLIVWARDEVIKILRDIQSSTEGPS